MKKLFLHIGAHKTGSTTIQNSLTCHSDYLTKKGFAAAIIHKDLDYLMTPLRLAYADPQGHLQNAITASRTRFQEWFNAQQAESIILSSELMTSNFASWREKANIAQQLFENIESITFIVFFRRQDYAYESIYRQAVRLGKTSLTFKEFYRAHEYSISHLNWYRNINYYRSAFPQAEVIVRPYETVADQPDFFREFLSILGIRNIPINITTSRDNVGITGHALELLRIANKHYSGKKLRLVRDFVIQNRETLGTHGQEGLFSFTPRERRGIVKNFHRSNQRLFEQFHIATPQEFAEWESH